MLKVKRATKILKEIPPKKWYLIDAEGQILGRIATRVADIIRGKNKPSFSPHQNLGDNVIVINAEKIKVTGTKLETKEYHHHSGYPGGLKTITLGRLLEKHPTEALKKAVWGMLPKNRLRSQIIKNLKLISGPSHKYEAQKPEIIKL